MASDSFKAVYGKMDPNHRESGFEIFGLDFMIDDSYNVWLIEVNTNPCLELSSPLLSRLIPQMLENAFRIALDPIFPPPPIYSAKKVPYENILEQNKFEIIFDEIEDATILMNTKQPICKE